jgi:hypothetical protein
MYRIQSDCYEASPMRLNQAAIISEMDDFHASIYPNPANDFINVNSESPIHQVDIVNADGTLVESIKTNEMNVQIPLESLENGIYFLKVCSNDDIYTERFIKN